MEGQYVQQTSQHFSLHPCAPMHCYTRLPIPLPTRTSTALMEVLKRPSNMLTYFARHSAAAPVLRLCWVVSINTSSNERYSCCPLRELQAFLLELWVLLGS